MPFIRVHLLLFFSVFACVTTARAAPVAPHGQDPDRSYRALVEAYRAGETADALAGVRSLGPGDLRAAVKRLAGSVTAASRIGGELPLDLSLLRAAAVLHADAAAEAWSRQDAERAGLHIGCGALLIEALSGRGSTAGPFRRRWYLATALMTSRYAAPEATLDYFERVTTQMPGDVTLLTAAGWFAERWSFARIRPAARRRYQNRAAEWLTAAIEASPGAPGATLRLARIESSRGHDAQARELLVPLLARDDVPLLVAYVGRLVLGGVHERSGQPAEAERRYREAMTLVPPAQSARLALARLKYATDPASAADTVGIFLSSGTDGPGNDPWADYQLAYLPLAAILLDELRLEVQQ